MSIPEPIARLLSVMSKDAEAAVFDLLGKVLTSPNPREAAAKAAQVLAHELASEAAMEAMFEARRRVPVSGV